MGSIRGSRRAALQAAAGHDNDNGGAMTLTMDVLDRLHAADPNAATELVQDSADAVALIELLEMLWNCGIPRRSCWSPCSSGCCSCVPRIEHVRRGCGSAGMGRLSL